MSALVNVLITFADISVTVTFSVSLVLVFFLPAAVAGAHGRQVCELQREGTPPEIP